MHSIYMYFGLKRLVIVAVRVDGIRVLAHAATTAAEMHDFTTSHIEVPSSLAIFAQLVT